VTRSGVPRHPRYSYGQRMDRRSRPGGPCAVCRPCVAIVWDLPAPAHDARSRLRQYPGHQRLSAGTSVLLRTQEPRAKHPASRCFAQPWIPAFAGTRDVWQPSKGNFAEVSHPPEHGTDQPMPWTVPQRPHQLENARLSYSPASALYHPRPVICRDTPLFRPSSQPAHHPL
jgi:hypothetical protein